MGYGDWVHITITNKSRSRTLKISYIDALYGKFYEGNKDNEVQPGAFINKEIPPKGSLDIYSCGRSDSPSGTEGNVTIADSTDSGNVEVVNVYWDCPYSGQNKFHKTRENNEDYIVALSSFSTSGPLKDISVDIAYLG
ncbi:aegerolysin type hemolysin [Panaeolus papilionaceus]|nr:aegerolysin type hemolysin [Panaeolus papilionaceus]